MSLILEAPFKTALYIAAGNWRLASQVEQLLMRAQIDQLLTLEGPKNPLYVQDINGNIPLHEAAAFGNVYAVEALLHAGSPVNAKNQKDEPPLYKARFAWLSAKGKDKDRYTAAITILAQAGGKSGIP